MNHRWRETPSQLLATSFPSFLRWLVRGLELDIVFAAAFGLLVGIIDVTLAFMTGWLIDEISAGSLSGIPIWSIAPQLILTGLLFSVVKPGLQWFETHWKLVILIPRVVPVVGQRLFDAFVDQPLSFLSMSDPGRLSHKLLRTASVTSGLLMECLTTFPVLLTTVVGSAILILSLEPLLLGFLLLWVLAVAASTMAFIPRMRLSSSIRAEADAELTGGLVDVLSNIRSVKLFSNEGREKLSIKVAFGDLHATSRRYGRENTNFRLILFVLTGILPVVLIGVAILNWTHGVGSPGEVATMSILAARVSNVTSSVSLAMSYIYRNIAEIEYGMTMFRSVDLLSDRRPSRAEEEASGSTGFLEFRNVSFAYDGTDVGVHDCSFVIRKGEHVSIIGPSGSGKSTLVSLIIGQLTPRNGSIWIDGRPTAMMTGKEITDFFALASQSEAPFNRTILENVLYGRWDAGHEEVDNVLSLSGLRELSAERDGDKHRIGPRGGKLSGGQRQRLLLARAILKNSPVLILDEATSALDFEGEQEVLGAVMAHCKDRSLIVISHRPSAIPEVDRVIVMDRGRIIEMGSPTELKARNGYYTRFGERS